jgi:hypothetical protein
VALFLSGIIRTIAGDGELPILPVLQEPLIIRVSTIDGLPDGLVSGCQGLSKRANKRRHRDLDSNAFQLPFD